MRAGPSWCIQIANLEKTAAGRTEHAPGKSAGFNGSGLAYVRTMCGRSSPQAVGLVVLLVSLPGGECPCPTGAAPVTGTEGQANGGTPVRQACVPHFLEATYWDGHLTCGFALVRARCAQSRDALSLVKGYFS